MSADNSIPIITDFLPATNFVSISLIFESAFYRNFCTFPSFDNKFKLLGATAHPMDKIKLVFSSR